MAGQRSLFDRVTLPEGHPQTKKTEQTEQTEQPAPPATAAGPASSAPAGPRRKRTRLDVIKAEWKREYLAELREQHWVVPENPIEGEDEGPGQGLTAGQALRKTELLQDLEELKGIKDQHLEHKRELQEKIAGLQKELEAADAAFREAKVNISEVVRKLNKLPRE